MNSEDHKKMSFGLVVPKHLKPLAQELFSSLYQAGYVDFWEDRDGHIAPGGPHAFGLARPDGSRLDDVIYYIRVLYASAGPNVDVVDEADRR